MVSGLTKIHDYLVSDGHEPTERLCCHAHDNRPVDAVAERLFNNAIDGTDEGAQ